MTVAEDRMIEAINEIIATYDDNPEYLYGPIERARGLVEALAPKDTDHAR